MDALGLSLFPCLIIKPFMHLSASYEWRIPLPLPLSTYPEEAEMAGDRLCID